MFELGLEAKDKITGFSGLLIARHIWITGCDQYTISPPKKEDGTLGENYNFDEGRIEIIGPGITVQSVQSETSGGPQPSTKPATVTRR